MIFYCAELDEVVVCIGLLLDIDSFAVDWKNVGNPVFWSEYTRERYSWELVGFI